MNPPFGRNRCVYRFARTSGEPRIEAANPLKIKIRADPLGRPRPLGIPPGHAVDTKEAVA